MSTRNRPSNPFARFGKGRNAHRMQMIIRHFPQYNKRPLSELDYAVSVNYYVLALLAHGDFQVDKKHNFVSTKTGRIYNGIVHIPTEAYHFDISLLKLDTEDEASFRLVDELLKQREDNEKEALDYLFHHEFPDEIVNGDGLTFAERAIQLMHDFGIEHNTEGSKKFQQMTTLSGNIFSQIYNHSKTYQPTERIADTIAVVYCPNLDVANDLLRRASYAIDNQSEHRIYLRHIFLMNIHTGENANLYLRYKKVDKQYWLGSIEYENTKVK